MSMRTVKTARLLLLSGIATAALMTQAMALDAQSFLDRLATVYESVGYEFSFGAASLDGDTVRVDGVTIAFSETGLEPMHFDAEITFSGVVEAADGSYSVEAVTIPDIDAEFGGEDADDPVGHITVSDMRADGLYLPASETLSAVEVMQLVGSISTGALELARNGELVMSIESMEAMTHFNPAQGSPELVDLHSMLAISGIALDLTSVGEEDPSAAAVIEALGLTTITGDITQQMSWSMADGRMAVDEFLFDFADIGALNIRADFTGLTPDVLDQLYAMQASMAGGEMSEEQAQAQMMSGMALMQGVSIVGTSVRYDDASLAGRLLDFFAASSGSERAEFVTGLKAMLPAMLAETGIPALNDLVVPPVSAFLDDPQSLEVRIAPPSPTSLLVLMAAAANPAGLITALGLAVEANAAE
jgi:hypothetical protein